MAKLIQVANAGENTEKMNDFSAIPVGNYTAQIVKSEFKPTKAKTGHYLQMQFKIVEGKFKGRVLFERLNLDNPNPIAVEIANKSLNTICDACGKVGVEDSEELHGIPMTIVVSQTAATPTQPAGNEIKMFKKYEGNMEPETTPVESSVEKPSKLPWEK